MPEDEPQSSLNRERSVDRVHAIVRALVRARSSASGEDPAQLIRLLQLTLPAHFAVEERPQGFFDQLEARGASILLLDRLRSEHREFNARLERLGRLLASGQPVEAELTALTDRLREHEWVESMTAAQRNLLAPSDLPTEPDPAGATLDPAVGAAVEEVADRCRALATQSTLGDLLAAVTVSVPHTVPIEGVLARLDHALAERGLEFLEVNTSSGEDVRLCGARFRRPRVGAI
jgi:Hemerythrin HHE cation binding domain